MQTFSHRLRQALALRGKTQADLVKATNISQSSVSDYLNGKYKPNQIKTYLIANYLNVSYNWLLGFDDDIEPDTNKELKITDIGQTVKIPVYKFVKAGSSKDAAENIEGYVQISADLDKEERQLIALQVSSDSMLPDFKKNDIVIIKECTDCKSGQDCAVFINDENAELKRVIKQNNGLLLQALNPEYETKFYPYEGKDKVAILGVVTQLIRKFE